MISSKSLWCSIMLAGMASLCPASLSSWTFLTNPSYEHLIPFSLSGNTRAGPIFHHPFCSLRQAIADLRELISILRESELDPKELRATFEELARTESDCSSAKRGGDLGFFGRSEFRVGSWNIYICL